MTDVNSPKREEIEQAPEVCLTFVDAGENAYLSITGTAHIVNDPKLRARAWRKNDIVWWPGGPNDPNAYVLVIEPAVAELWDGPSSKAVVAYEFAKARLTGTEPDVGENRKVSVNMEQQD
jgi:general stress protein 26